MRRLGRGSWIAITIRRVPVSSVSYADWESRYAKSTSALGSTVWIAGTAFTVIGVMPPGYAGTLMDWYAGPSFWIPLSKVRQVLPPLRALDFENMRSMQWLMMVARMWPGVEAEQLQAALNIAARREPRAGEVQFSGARAQSGPVFPRASPGHRSHVMGSDGSGAGRRL